jgi:GPH family glycoside/pentoside/hexuronide:cation symporter
MAKGLGMFSSSIFDSRIKSANVQNSERWLGYFASPAIIYVAYYIMAGTYLNQFYVDVVKAGGIAGGAFLVVLPLLSKIFDAITNLTMGQIIDRTKSRQGKARPWILISAPLVAITGILLYAIPQAGNMVKAIWIAVSYNLYFAFAFTIYNMGQILLIPLSTHNTKQRDGLALFLSMGQTMIPGMLVYIVFPLVALPWMGVSGEKWATVMSIISIVVLPGVLLQYYFTKERVSEDATASKVQSVGLLTQLKTCLSDKYWIFFFLMWLAYQFQQNMFSTSVIFYSNWVLGTYNDGTTLTLINAVGQAPLGLGVFLLWPIAKKIGKRKTMIGGMTLAAAASLSIMIAPSNMGAVLGALVVKSFGFLPTYLLTAMMAEAMDHIEWKNGYRCDGLSATANTVMITVMAGVAISVFNSGINFTGYVPPAADGTWIAQNAATQNYFVICVSLVPAVCLALVAVMAYLFKVEPMMPQITADITARHRAEAEARGEVYISSEEKAALELAEQERIAEEKRIEELQVKCSKKGLNFAQEEAKYQEKLAAKRAKAEAKKRK